MKNSFVNASAVADWQGVLASRGLDAGNFGNLSLKASDHSEDGGSLVVDLKEFVSFLEQVGQVKDSAGLSWAVGHASNYSKRGYAGRAVLGAKNLGTAFSRLAQYYPLIQDDTQVTFDVGEQWSTLSYRILDPDIWPRTEDALYSLGIFATFIKSAAPDAWHSVEMFVECDAETIKRDVSDIVKTNVEYKAESNGFRFPTSLLNRELDLLPAVDGDHMKRLSRLLSEQKRRMPASDRTRQKIFEGLSKGKVNQDHIALELGMSRRTLRRKLAGEGESFQSILDECRMRAASLEFKICKTQSLSEMALKLGYSEHSTFSRAFMRWAGMAPQQFRQLAS
ncbi:AraC family transcriptional regulator ligand-binding domain-containing protein [Kordiimonas lipolytica]|uniref:AraC family transcriptional regulator ligand-binding domain-containing protein n=1 Tax=Kordiimonas lipolytica TaxID=1662421 RepID=A0ABV8U8Z0_9PROT|nr:AraC family transcriptional regulator [Kordiimonas lipolytica]